MIFANGSAVLGGTLSVPDTGAWMADVSVGSSISAGSVVAIVDGSASWIGTAMRTGVVGSRCYARIIGGAGRIGSEVGAQHFRATTVGVVLSSVLAAAGELSSPLSDPTVLATPLPSWSRSVGPLGAELDRLAVAAGCKWRVLSDGTVWLGYGLTRLTPPSGSVVLDGDPATGQWVYAPGSLDVWPDDAGPDGTVSHVTYHLDSPLRATVYTE